MSLMENVLDEAFQGLFVRSINDVQCALESIKDLLAFVAPRLGEGSEDAEEEESKIMHFLRLQDTFEYNVTTRLLSSLPSLLSYSDDEQAQTQAIQLMTLLQGLALIHRGSKNLMGRRCTLKILTSVLSLRPNPSPTSDLATTSTLLSTTLDTLLCILVDAPQHIRTFEALEGVEAVVRLLKRGGTPRVLRMKCLEFLYFYLLDENAKPVDVNVGGLDAYVNGESPTLASQPVTAAIHENEPTYETGTVKGRTRTPPTALNHLGQQETPEQRRPKAELTSVSHSTPRPGIPTPTPTPQVDESRLTSKERKVFTVTPPSSHARSKSQVVVPPPPPPQVFLTSNSTTPKGKPMSMIEYAGRTPPPPARLPSKRWTEADPAMIPIPPSPTKRDGRWRTTTPDLIPLPSSPTKKDRRKTMTESLGPLCREPSPPPPPATPKKHPRKSVTGAGTATAPKLSLPRISNSSGRQTPPTETYGLLRREIDFIPTTPKKPYLRSTGTRLRTPGLGSRTPSPSSTPDENRPPLPSGRQPTSHQKEVTEKDGEGGVIRSMKEKKEILRTMLGNVDALVEDVGREGVWGLG